MRSTCTSSSADGSLVSVLPRTASTSTVITPPSRRMSMSSFTIVSPTFTRSLPLARSPMLSRAKKRTPTTGRGSSEIFRRVWRPPQVEPPMQPESGYVVQLSADAMVAAKSRQRVSPKRMAKFYGCTSKFWDRLQPPLGYESDDVHESRDTGRERGQHCGRRVEQITLRREEHGGDDDHESDRRRLNALPCAVRARQFQFRDAVSFCLLEHEYTEG